MALSSGAAGLSRSAGRAQREGRVAGALLGSRRQQCAISAFARDGSAALGLGPLRRRLATSAKGLAMALRRGGVVGGKFCRSHPFQRGFLPGGQLGGDRVDARLRQSTRSIHLSWSTKGDLRLCNRKTNSPNPLGRSRPRVVDAGISLGPAPHWKSATSSQEKTNVRSSSIMDAQAAAAVGIERRRPRTCAPGSQ